MKKQPFFKHTHNLIKIKTLILGSGDIGTAIKESGIDRNDVIFFCSGVSNSKETDKKQFQREYRLLLEQDRGLHLVYFSTLSIYYGDSDYVNHKKNMEMCIKKMFNKYTIIRIGNITWGNNPNTIINHFRNKVKNGEYISIDDVNDYRFLVDKKEFIHWLKLIPVGSKNEMNITGKMISVPDLAQQIHVEAYKNGWLKHGNAKH